jgi:hypothetical protein
LAFVPRRSQKKLRDEQGVFIKHPSSEWMPWNFRETLVRVAAPAAA